jgi:S1 RNA binding domain protein
MALQAGEVVEGSVEKLVEYGVFVRLPTEEVGLVHISQIADAFVRDVAEYFKVGDPVKVKVLGTNDRGRYELSVKDAERREPVYADPGAAAPPPRRPSGGRTSAEFEERLTDFLKRSDDRLLDLRRNRDARRKGRRR